MLEGELTPILSEIATDHDLDPAVLMAVVEVESHGRPGVWLGSRFEPMIRFEGHYFHRLLPPEKVARAVRARLASPIAGEIRNPILQLSRWKLVARASRIDRTAALSSVSWGVGQVMGAHWDWLGYASIDELVNEARSGVAGQVRLMMRYIQKAGLKEKLEQCDWAGFARAYNGPAFKKHRYDRKLAKAHRKYAASLNCPGREPVQSRGDHALELKLGSSGKAVRQLQSELCRLGYTVLVDGDFGPATKAAVMRFQNSQGLVVDGVLGKATTLRLFRMVPSHH